MVLSEAPGSLSKFRRTPWKFQQTFHTPLENLQPFVKTIVSAAQPLTEGCVTIDQWVFEPKHLIDLFASYSIPPQYGHEQTLTASGVREVEALLQAVFADWIDFIFAPKPKSFAIYADHDKYATFFAHTRSGLNRVALPLADQGFEIIQGYERYF
jgi:hypothetical protein